MNQHTPKFGEKYVSIEYERWENHYKGLEEENKYLKEQLERKDIRIQMSQRWGYGDVSWYIIGEVYVSGGGITIKDFDKERFIQSLKEQCGYNILPTKEEEERVEEAIKTQKQIDRLPRLIKWLFKIK